MSASLTIMRHITRTPARRGKKGVGLRKQLYSAGGQRNAVKAQPSQALQGGMLLLPVTQKASSQRSGGAPIVLEGGEPFTALLAHRSGEGKLRFTSAAIPGRQCLSGAAEVNDSSSTRLLKALRSEMRGAFTPIPRFSGQRRSQIFTSTLRLPFTARWDDHVLSPGKYEIILVDTSSAPVVAIHGRGVAAMVTPAYINKLEGTQVSILFLMPGEPLARVQLLRLASAQVDLRFQESTPDDGCPTILALPLREHARYEFV